MKGLDRYRVGGVSCMCAGRPRPVVNLSVGGFFVESDDPPPAGELLDVDLFLPQRRPLQLKGEVAWVNDRAAPVSLALPPGFGVKLTRVSLDARMALMNVLRDAGAWLPRAMGDAGQA